MNIKTLAILASVFAQPAVACNYDLISMTGWKITPKDSDSNILETAFVFNGDRDIRMIDASAQFSDVLGGRIASFAVDRYLLLESGAVFNQTGLWGQYTFERLLDMDKADVETRVCVKAVIYADGEKETFN